MGQQKIPAAIVGPGNIGTEPFTETQVRDTVRAPDTAGMEATHRTEADVSPQHFAVARELGTETAGFLMTAHMTDPENLAKQAPIMIDAGRQARYVTDSAGALLMDDARARFEALVAEVGDEAWVGYHGHQNAERYKVPAHAIARRCGERGYVDTQEDMIIDIDIALAEEQTT
ncbi:hypothetical protein [Streptomyces rapamycinicus]|uniref:Pyruvate carboxyltransferase domain-containing protein n=2 Tax=Streptomyces rapamycinicus TaxID=1226757 RepID=A0A0A0NXF4_STRRN|nr:hypothetical protein [Streptomyces rapamycinicus]AGP61435.1 hypothetical protein M271_50390 [Streptomyces rapamycinicus NRRL 5491]MBB4787379.1 4-hydroxy 2-oxovalerate aldolase [Streptomyces rapamycinicus]RLV71726.1 hypothetical protein D3C57_144405 [Streptomyces rapamycinicus NRRL 5491]UTP36890.1 hypothetical protein LIV37_51390 [Streptomyces rapamycinicus NRRL 5491]